MPLGTTKKVPSSSAGLKPVLEKVRRTARNPAGPSKCHGSKTEKVELVVTVWIFQGLCAGSTDGYGVIDVVGSENTDTVVIADVNMTDCEAGRGRTVDCDRGLSANGSRSHSCLKSTYMRAQKNPVLFLGYCAPFVRFPHLSRITVRFAKYRRELLMGQTHPATIDLDVSFPV